MVLLSADPCPAVSERICAHSRRSGHIRFQHCVQCTEELKLHHRNLVEFTADVFPCSLLICPVPIRIEFNGYASYLVRPGVSRQRALSEARSSSIR
jgi:hypothetical protein